MKNVGIIRNVDNLGRVVIPKEMRKEFQLIEHEPVEILATENGVLIRKPAITCLVCGEEYEVEIERVKLCKKCLDKIRNF